MGAHARRGRTEPDPTRGLDAERERVEAARADPARFAPLYETHFELVYAFVARRVAGRAEAEDVTGEVFRKALAALPEFEWRGVPFAAWLLRIARNLLADRARVAEQAAQAALASGEPEAEEIDADALERATLYRLVAELPADQRRVIELRFAEERSTREIAALLGRSEGAVKQLQLRALRALRKRMGKDDAGA